MKKIIIVISCLLSASAHAQQANTTFDGRNWQAPYALPIPKGWSIERFLLPPAFAPQIKYKGVEDIRFTPGWGNSKTNDYWSYAFLWYLDDKYKISKKTIEADLEAYYNGLLKENTDSTKALTEAQMPAVVKLKQSVTEGHETLYSGEIIMRDFLSRQRIILNAKVHLSFCPDAERTILYFELSPKPFTDEVWDGLDSLWTDFKCTKDQ